MFDEYLMKKIFILVLALALNIHVFGQTEVQNDTLDNLELDTELEKIIQANRQQQIADSLERLKLTIELNNTRLESEQ